MTNDYYIKSIFVGCINQIVSKKWGIDILKIDQDGEIEILYKPNSHGELEQQKAVDDEKNEQVVEAMEQLIQFFTDSFESIHDMIYNIDYQLHSDKIEQAKGLQESFEKRIVKNDIDGVKILRYSVEETTRALFSDMKTRVSKCNSVPVTKKKMLFGYLKVKEIREALCEIKETLPIYMNTMRLLSGIELYLGESDNAQRTWEKAIDEIKKLFSYEEPQNNRMYTLTDESFWVEEPKKYCDIFYGFQNKLYEFQDKLYEFQDKLQEKDKLVN